MCSKMQGLFQGSTSVDVRIKFPESMKPSTAFLSAHLLVLWHLAKLRKNAAGATHENANVLPAEQAKRGPKRALPSQKRIEKGHMLILYFNFDFWSFSLQLPKTPSPPPVCFFVMHTMAAVVPKSCFAASWVFSHPGQHSSLFHRRPGDW